MTRATHDRTRDHRGTDTTDNILLSGSVGGYDAGDPLDSLLATLATTNSLLSHLEVVMADFGSGLEPVTDADGDWLYAYFQGA